MTRPALTYLDAAVKGRPYAWARTATTKTGRRVNPAPYRRWKATAAEVLAAHARWRAFDPAAELTVAVIVHPNGVTVRAVALDRPTRAGLTGDVDNYAKAVLDAMQDAGVLADDLQIVSLLANINPDPRPKATP